MALEFANYPLPSNWEQKYDFETKRFFYIDHFKKITTWIDPRIDLCKRDHQASTSVNQPSPSVMTSREKKAKAIHQKFPKYTIEKISEYLADNYDNVSSVEGFLQREHQLAEQQLEQVEMNKKLVEDQKKAEKEERDNRIKEISNQKALQNSKRKAEEEAKLVAMREEMKHKAELEAKLKIDEANKQRAIIDKLKTDVANLKTKTEDSDKQGPNVGGDKRATGPQPRVAKESKTKLNKGPNKAIYNGANPSNQSGPNLNLLSSNRITLAKGPDPANRFGPRPDLRIQALN